MSSRIWLLIWCGGICVGAGALLVVIIDHAIVSEHTLMEMLPIGLPLAFISLLAASGVVALLRERRKDP